MFKRFFLFTLPLAILFSACIVPEKFTLDIYINADGTYYYTFKGTVKNFEAFYEIEAYGKLANESYYRTNLLSIGDASDQIFSKIEYTGAGEGYLDFTSERTNGLLLFGFLPNPYSFGFIETKKETIILTLDNSYHKDLNAEMIKYGFNPYGEVIIHSELPINSSHYLPKNTSQTQKANEYIIRFFLTEIPENQIILSFIK